MDRIGILTSGGDAPGMNAVVRAVVRQANDLGLEVMGIKRGFAGLIKGEIAPLTDGRVSGKINRGGTFLLTARSKEFRTEEGQKKALNQLKRFGIEGLVVVGGDGSLAGARSLHERGFPTVGVPASIDNDLGFTDYSIGFDSAMNTIVDAVNRIRDTATSHERIFVIETMGRENGLLTLEAGLAVGAEAIIIPEIEHRMEEICRRVESGYAAGKLHNIILVAEGIGGPTEASPDGKRSAAYEIGRDIQDKTGYETRIIVLGHIQRGGSPTALDRIYASRLGSFGVKMLYENRSGLMAGIQRDEVAGIEFDKVLAAEKTIDRSLYDLAHVLS